MYRRLAAETRRLSHLLASVSEQLQRCADSEPHATTAPPSVNTTGSAETEARTRQFEASSSGKEAAVVVQCVKDLVSWVQQKELQAWLLPSPSLSPPSVDALRQQWLSTLWSPPASEAAYRSSANSVGSSSALLSDVEKALTNRAATALHLPSRFHWSASPAAPSSSTSSSSHASSGVSDTPVTASSLWPTAMRTTSGTVAPRRTATPMRAAAAALPALLTAATAGDVFAAAPSSAGVPVGSGKRSEHPPKTSLALTGSHALSQGGGVAFTERLEAYLVLLHTARTQALTRSTGQHNAFAGNDDTARLQSRLVMYTSDQVDPLLLRAAQLIGLTQVRMLQTVDGESSFPSAAAAASVHATTPAAAVRYHNYALDVKVLQARLVEDVAVGLYPMLVIGTFGSGLSGAVDPLTDLASFCAKLGVWFHIDASHGGHALLATGRRCDIATSNSDSSGDASRHSAQSSCSSSSSRLAAALACEFYAAAQNADSIAVAAGCSSLPYPVLPSAALAPVQRGTQLSATVLFVAHVRKVAWSVQRLGGARQQTYNQHCTPGVSDSDMLRVSPLSHACPWLMQQALSCVPTANASVSTSVSSSCTAALTCARDTCMSKQVEQHQQLMAALLHRVRSDDRFDASLDGSVFGVVHLRWLMAADEVTAQLAQAWNDELAADIRNSSSSRLVRHEQRAGEETSEWAAPTVADPPVQVYIGIVQLQRRLWVTLALGPLSRETPSSQRGGACDARPETESPASYQRAADYVLSSLDAAARRVRPQEDP